MDSPAPRNRHLADRPRLQPAGRRLARRLRSAAILLILAACSKEKAPTPEPAYQPREDFRARFLETRYGGIETFDVRDLVAGLKAYIDSDDPVYPPEDWRYRALHAFLYGQRPAPAGLRPLLGPHTYTEIDGPLLKRDKIAVAVVTTLIRRIFRDPEDPHRKELFDVVAEAGVWFSFDPIYEDSHPLAGEEIGDFFATDHAVVPESQAAVRKHLDALITQWQGRVTRKGSSTFFGIILRHVGVDGADRLFGEWKRMDEDERYDLLKRAASEEELGKKARAAIARAFLDPCYEVREAAFEALKAHGAPLGELDESSRDDEISKAMPEILRWAES